MNRFSSSQPSDPSGEAGNQEGHFSGDSELDTHTNETDSVAKALYAQNETDGLSITINTKIQTSKSAICHFKDSESGILIDNKASNIKCGSVHNDSSTQIKASVSKNDSGECVSTIDQLIQTSEFLYRNIEGIDSCKQKSYQPTKSNLCSGPKKVYEPTKSKLVVVPMTWILHRNLHCIQLN